MVEEVIWILPHPMMCPLSLSPKVTTPPSFVSRVTNYSLSPIICLEQPLSKYQLLLASLAARHTYITKSSIFRYPSFLGSFQVSQNGSFWNPYFLYSCVCRFVKEVSVWFMSYSITFETSNIGRLVTWIVYINIFQKFLFFQVVIAKSSLIIYGFLIIKNHIEFIWTQGELFYYWFQLGNFIL